MYSICYYLKRVYSANKLKFDTRDLIIKKLVSMSKACINVVKNRLRNIYQFNIFTAQGPSTVVQVNQTPGNNQYTQPLYPEQPGFK